MRNHQIEQTNAAQEKGGNAKNESMKIDFLLVALYFVIVAVMFWVLLARVDFMMYLLPYGVILAVTLLLLNYLRHIMKSIHKEN